MVYEDIKEKLAIRPATLEDVRDWLFVTLNTAKAMIETVNRSQFQELDACLDCQCVQELQLLFDSFQGKFGGASFSQRRSPIYLYLCSLVALFPNQTIGDEERQYMKSVLAVSSYLLYDL